MALGTLKHYSNLDGSFRQKAAKMYGELRTNVISSVHSVSSLCRDVGLPMLTTGLILAGVQTHRVDLGAVKRHCRLRAARSPFHGLDLARGPGHGRDILAAPHYFHLQACLSISTSKVTKEKHGHFNALPREKAAVVFGRQSVKARSSAKGR